MSELYTADDVCAACAAIRESTGLTVEEVEDEACAVLEAVAPAIARKAASRALKTAAADPNARLSGHSGVSVRWLRAMADEIEAAL